MRNLAGASLLGDDATARRRVSLVVVNFNSLDLLRSLVTSIGEAVDEVIVVDNASSEGGFDEWASNTSAVRVCRSPTNVGYGAGANLGASMATGDVLVVANPDVSITPDALAALVGNVRDDVALAAPRFHHPDGSLQPSAHHREPFVRTTLVEMCYPLTAVIERYRPGLHPTLCAVAAHQQDLDVTHVLGALMAIDAEAFRSVGGFDEGFFLYREETDLCRRLRAAGYRIRHVGTVVAVHASGGSTPETGLTVSRRAYLDSHYRYIAKHAGRAAAIAARVAGTLGALVWLAVGPRRSEARAVVAWHLGR